MTRSAAREWKIRRGYPQTRRTSGGTGHDNYDAEPAPDPLWIVSRPTLQAPPSAARSEERNELRMSAASRAHSPGASRQLNRVTSPRSWAKRATITPNGVRICQSRASAAFERLAEPSARIKLHCYRMLGSLHDPTTCAETHLRAWRVFQLRALEL